MTPAKLSRPRLYDAYPRERLFALLDEARQHPVVWVHGPPGAGKTTLVASYLEARRVRAAWYQLDAGDSDPATVFSYLAQLAHTRPGRRPAQTLSAFGPEVLANVAGFTRVFGQAFFTALGPRTVLVLDDVQEAGSDARWLALLESLVLEAAASAGIWVIGRAAPPPEFARLLANRAIALVGGKELELAREECAGIARLRGAWDEDTLERLHLRAAGWAAGLTLLLERIRRGDSVEDVTAGRLLPEVFDYFASQVLGRRPPEDRDMLLRLCHLPRMDPQTACELCGTPRAESLLESLFRAQMFTYRERGKSRAGAAESSAVSYRFHALLRESLQQEARRVFPSDRLAEVQAQAAACLESEGDLEAAIGVCIEAGRWQAAAGMLVRIAPGLLDRARNEALVRWFSRMPRHALAANGWGLYWLGAALAPLRWGEGRELLGQAHGRFESAGDQFGMVASAASAVETYVREYDRFGGIDFHLDVLVRLLGDGIAFPSSAARLGTYAVALAGLAHRTPWHPKVLVWSDRVLDWLLAVGLGNRCRLGPGGAGEAATAVRSNCLGRCGALRIRRRLRGGATLVFAWPRGGRIVRSPSQRHDPMPVRAGAEADARASLEHTRRTFRDRPAGAVWSEFSARPPGNSRFQLAPTTVAGESVPQCDAYRSGPGI